MAENRETVTIDLNIEELEYKIAPDESGILVVVID
jgi:hypothetical protein